MTTSQIRFDRGEEWNRAVVPVGAGRTPRSSGCYLPAPVSVKITVCVARAAPSADVDRHGEQQPEPA
ncbi:hypothetical protein IQ272_00095 [Chroococcidiopsidales cyanobacterium LEGE 13417]|uniref:hypothetical protein n=1 Tax=Chroococcidiopsis sp. CCALA 051 TaxID=869949 RepID=UPI001304B54C|nr:hypothetical protein [Chroococcidiopsis sp. CCALA 051]MBE9014581.1 hypothetical protein [Chroococcidiopsidales cyanobacterium LEGE 13417]